MTGARCVCQIWSAIWVQIGLAVLTTWANADSIQIRLGRISNLKSVFDWVEFAPIESAVDRLACFLHIVTRLTMMAGPAAESDRLRRTGASCR